MKQEDGLSELQQVRRQKSLNEILASKPKWVTNLDFNEVFILNQLLLKAYNAGYADSQNETRDSFKLE